MNQTWAWLRLQKEGILYGSLIGALAFMLYSNLVGYPALFAMQSPAILDGVTHFSIEQKVFAAFVIAGATIGMIVDAIWKPNQ